jgi:hypothetical protein
VLRTLAALELERGPADPVLGQRLEVFLRLFSRVFHPNQRALIKATSFVSELAPLALAQAPQARAILMFVAPATYLAGILGGPASRAEARANAEARLARLHRRLGAAPWRAADLSEGEVAAMGWTCEVMALAQTAALHPNRVMWLDFEALLTQPGPGLAKALTLLRGSAPEAEVAAMLASPDFHRYAKAPEFAYDAGLRRRVLDQAREEHAEEIERGLEWINGAGRAHAKVAEAVRAVAAAARA